MPGTVKTGAVKTQGRDVATVDAVTAAAKRAAASATDAVTTATLAVTEHVPDFAYTRRFPMPGRAVHPSVQTAAFTKRTQPDDTTCVERIRDKTLAFLAAPLLSLWTVVSIMLLLMIVGWGALLFFLLINVAPGGGWWQNISNQVLAALFTYGVLLTAPWRLANVHHLWCSVRSSAPGGDFYARKTEAIWFHIPAFHRKGITLFMLGNTAGEKWSPPSPVIAPHRPP